MRPRTPPVTLSAAVLLGLAATDPAARPLRLLVAEPDAARRAMIRDRLEEAGDSAVCVADWQEALGELARRPVDAVLLSLALPRAGGLGAGRTLRAWPPPVSSVPLLALQGGPVRLQEKDWRDAGFDALLAWPDALPDLAATLRALVLRLTPAAPLDPATRAALLADLGAEALASRDMAALREAAAGMAALRLAADPEAAAAAAASIAAACDRIGARAAAEAARAAGEDPDRRLDALANALAAAGTAIRFAGRAQRVTQG